MDKKERRRKYMRAYNKTEKRRAYMSRYYVAHGKKSNERFTKRNNDLRSEVISLLGGKCCKCGFSDIRALQIDHVNGGGTKELKDVYHRKGKYFYLTQVKAAVNKASSVYQLLCANCNWIKRVERKEHNH